MDDLPPPHLEIPPLLKTPPVITPPPARAGGRTWLWVFLTVLVLGLAGMGYLVKSVFDVIDFAEPYERGGRGKPMLLETSVSGSSSSDKIVIIDVDGIITSMAMATYGQNMVDVIQEQFDMASKDRDVKAVILKIDSPGGEVMASDDIARAVREFQKKTKKPVIASMGSLAASGGYYVAAPCRWIVASQLTITGSIGVIMQSVNYRGLMDKVGVLPLVFKSGRFKDMLSMTKNPADIDPAEGKMIMEMIMETYDRFTQVVADGRGDAALINKTNGRTLVPDWKDYADGRILTGSKAYNLGFVDELGNFNTAVKTAEKLAEIEGEAHLIRYEEPFNIGNLLGLFGEVRSSSKALKLDIGLDLPKLRVGMPYFILSTTVADP